jgi:hypothetical protein
MAKSRAPSLFLLTRIAPEASSWSDDPWFYTHDGARRSGAPLGGFATKKAAEEVRERLEREAREIAPIGWFLRDLIPTRINDIVDAARAAGLPPPDCSAAGPKPRTNRRHTRDDSNYGDRLRIVVRMWWEAVSTGITPQANAILWDHLLPDYTFYSVDSVLLEE